MYIMKIVIVLTQINTEVKVPELRHVEKDTSMEKKKIKLSMK